MYLNQWLPSLYIVYTIKCNQSASMFHRCQFIYCVNRNLTVSCRLCCTFLFAFCIVYFKWFQNGFNTDIRIRNKYPCYHWYCWFSFNAVLEIYILNKRILISWISAILYYVNQDEKDVIGCHCNWEHLIFKN